MGKIIKNIMTVQRFHILHWYPCTWPLKWLSRRADNSSKNCFHTSYGANFDNDINSMKLSMSCLKAEKRFIKYTLLAYPENFTEMFIWV